MSDLEVLQFISLKMFYAVICGAVVGIERRMNFAPAGLKTQILVCVGSMLFTVSPQLAGAIMINETPRVIGQIVTGVGFLGAGSIIHNNSRSVSGLTTAAWIWFTAALGIFVGLGHGSVSLFISVTLVAVISLFRKVETKFFSGRIPLHARKLKEENQAPVRKAS
jgi:putative Mg2+ transporter-C (MgtC) family protein